jgi:type IV secretion system protein VirB10
MTAGDLTSAAKATGAAPDAKKNAEDDLFTSSVFKSGTRKSQVAQVKQPSGMPDVTDPAQMRAIQQAVAAGGRRECCGATPEGVAPQASSSDRQFLRDAGSLNTLRTGFDGKLPRCTLSRGFVIPPTSPAASTRTSRVSFVQRYRRTSTTPSRYVQNYSGRHHVGWDV